MAFIGNTTHTVPYMLKTVICSTNCPMPTATHGLARPPPPLHSRLGGRSDSLGDVLHGYGFVVDYLAEILRAKRSEDFSDKLQGLLHARQLNLDTRPGRHPQDLLGLMKLLHPTGEATEDDVRKLREFAIGAASA